MSSENKKPVVYEEGHKRETRKSYQAYIEQISTPKVPSDEIESELSGTVPSSSENRRSKRTPIRKRNFDEIQTDQPAQKRAKKSENEPHRSTNTQDVPDLSINVDDDASATVKTEEEEEEAPRKSGRVRKPKQFKDSVTPSYVKKSVERSLKTSSKKSIKVETIESGQEISPEKALSVTATTTPTELELESEQAVPPTTPTKETKLSQDQSQTLPTTKSPIATALVSEPTATTSCPEKENKDAAPLEEADERSERTDETEEDEVVPRKSGRVRKPKKFADSITPSYIKKSVERSLNTTSPDGTSNETGQEQEFKETPKRGRKKKVSQESEATVPPLGMTVKEKPLANISQPEDNIYYETTAITSPKKRHKSSSHSQENEPPSQIESPTKRSRGRPPKVANTPVESTKQESQDVKKKNQNKQDSGSKLIVSIKKKHKKSTSAVEETESDTYEIKDTEVGGSVQRNPMESATEESPTKKRRRKSGNQSQDETQVQPGTAKDNQASTVSIKKKKKDKKHKKSSNKLIVSFKKKEKKGKKPVPTVLSTPPPPPPPDTLEVKVKVKDVGNAVKSNLSSGSSKHKKNKKKKERTKEKLNSKNQKVVDVKAFEVDDPVVVKVKKKKIYKKRQGTKVLVRIIKNHCNTGGEIVKTETIVVDNVPVEEGEEEEISPNSSTATPDLLSPTQSSSLDTSFVEHDDKETGDDDGELNYVDPKDEEYVPSPESKQRSTKTKTAVTSSKSKPKQSNEIKTQKKVTLKQSAKKTFSRPANKNVTVGGKVVGKTTKGMKKTGDVVNTKKKKGMCECCTGQLLKITAPITFPKTSEPKNAYNLFCRRYRPMIVQNHPRADFAEISRRLASIWKSASEEDKKEYTVYFNQLTCAFTAKLSKLNKIQPSNWSENEFKYVKKAISLGLPFSIPQYSPTYLQPVDMAAHLQLLGNSLSVIGGALQKQSSMTVHGAMELLLDSMLCAIAPLLFLTSHVPDMKAISDEVQANTLDNIAYILPGL